MTYLLVIVKTGTEKSSVLKGEYPVTEGLILGTTKTYGRNNRLIATEGSTVSKKDKKLLD